MFNWASTCPSPHFITPLTTRLMAAPPKFSKWNAFDWSYQELNKCIYFYDLMIEKNKHSFSTQCDVSPVAGQPWWKVAIFWKKCRSLPFMAKPNWEIHRSPVRYRSFGWRNEDCGSGGCFGLRWYRDISSYIRHVTTQVVSHWKLPHSIPGEKIQELVRKDFLKPVFKEKCLGVRLSAASFHTSVLGMTQDMNGWTLVPHMKR